MKISAVINGLREFYDRAASWMWGFMILIGIPMLFEVGYYKYLGWGIWWSLILGYLTWGAILFSYIYWELRNVERERKANV